MPKEQLNEWMQTIMAHTPSEWGWAAECAACTFHSKSYDLQKICRRVSAIFLGVTCKLPTRLRAHPQPPCSILINHKSGAHPLFSYFQITCTHSHSAPGQSENWLLKMSDAERNLINCEQRALN
jgi:hypothetical protein